VFAADATIKVSVAFFTEMPVQGPLPFNPVVVFIMGDTILQAAENLPLKNDGTVTFSVVVPENTATFSIKVSDSYGNKISIFQESCFSLINVSHMAAQFGYSGGRAFTRSCFRLMFSAIAL